MKTATKSNLMQNLLAKGKLNIPKPGDTIEAKIISIKSTGIHLDLEKFKTAMILGREIKMNPQAFKSIKPGDTIAIKIIKLENEEGNVEASLIKAGEEKKWETLKQAMEKGDIIEATILKANKGGLMIEVNGIEAFMPVSQLSPSHYPRVEGGDKQKILLELNKLINTKIKLKIIDLNLPEKKLIVSEKAADQKKLVKALEKYKVGDKVEGEITGLVEFGAFVKFDDLEGLIHISEIDWQIIDNPDEFFKVGDKVKAKIVEIENNKISLSTKALKKNPWEQAKEKYKNGQVIKGKVTKFNPFGAFIQIDKNIQGLTHISEFGTEEKMKEILKLNKEYKFKILSIKPLEYRMALKPILDKK